MVKRKLLFGIIICICANLSADPKKTVKNATETVEPIKNQFSYVDVGLGPIPFPYPVIGFGYRNQNNHTGFGWNLRVLAGPFPKIGFSVLAKMDFLFLNYPSPNLEKQIYYGIGLGIGAFRTPKSCFSCLPFITPEFVIGKQFKTNRKIPSPHGGYDVYRFFQVQCDFPLLVCMIPIPAVTVHYGWGF